MKTPNNGYVQKGFERPVQFTDRRPTVTTVRLVDPSEMVAGFHKSNPNFSKKRQPVKQREDGVWVIPDQDTEEDFGVRFLIELNCFITIQGKIYRHGDKLEVNRYEAFKLLGEAKGLEPFGRLIKEIR